MGLEEIVPREMHVAIINSVVTLIYAKITPSAVNFYESLWYSANVHLLYSSRVSYFRSTLNWKGAYYYYLMTGLFSAETQLMTFLLEVNS